MPKRPIALRTHPSWNRRTALFARTLQRAAHRLTQHGCPYTTRRQVRRLAIVAPGKFGVRREWDELGGLSAKWFVPRGSADTLPIILYIHGGGFAICSPRSHRGLVSELALATGMRCAAIQYRLAPEHPFPTPIHDCVGAYRALLLEGYPADQIIIAGDSAGGNLALAMTQRIRSLGMPMPRALVLLSPWADLTCSAPSIVRHAPYDYLTPAIVRMFASHYAGDADPLDPLVSPRFADFSGFPPMLIQAGTAEILHDEICDMAERARRHGVDVTLQPWEGMFHAWHGFSFAVPEARQAFNAIGAFTSKLCASGLEQSRQSVIVPHPDNELLWEGSGLISV